MIVSKIRRGEAGVPQACIARCEQIPAARVPALLPSPIHFIGDAGSTIETGLAGKTASELPIPSVKTLEKIVRDRRRRRGRY